jgi:hypothetical protein
MVQSCTIRSFLLLLMAISLASSGCMANNPQSDQKTAVIFGNQIPSHPRLLFSESEEIKIKELRANDELLGDLFELLREKDGYQFFVLIVQPAEGNFLLEEAKTFTPGENPLSGYSILKFKTNSHHKNQTIQVVMGSNLNSLLTISGKNLQPILNWQ